MSTRCQVLIKPPKNPIYAQGFSEEELSVCLYHHCDGYPEAMYPTIEKCFNFQFNGHKNHQWQFERPGKIASYLCSVDPAQFEVERDLDLHGDIEFLYVIQPQGDIEGDNGKGWAISVYTPRDGFYDTCMQDNMNLLIHVIITEKNSVIDKKLKPKYCDI